MQNYSIQSLTPFVFIYQNKYIILRPKSQNICSKNKKFFIKTNKKLLVNNKITKRNKKLKKVVTNY